MPATVRAVFTVLVVVTLAACAGPEAVSGTAAPTPTAERATPTAPPPTATPPPTETPAPADPPPPTEEDCDDPAGCYGDPWRVGAFDAEAVPEASGLAASRRNADVLYLLDDRPGTSEVWVISTDGEMLGAITVDGLHARDTESLAIGPCRPHEPEPCVYVGDIGDNLRSRTDIVVHRFPEPDLAEGVPAEVAADAVRLTYPDGAHDAEALIVDDAGALFVVTKAPFDPETGATGETRLYRLADYRDGELEDLGVLDVPAPVSPLHSLVVGNVVTGGDYRDGRVLLRTYDQVLEYRAPGASAELAELADWRVRALPSPVEPQSEAITWDHDGCGYYTAGELVGDLWYVPCRP